jgi:hypothetical protein
MAHLLIEGFPYFVLRSIKWQGPKQARPCGQIAQEKAQKRQEENHKENMGITLRKSGRTA